MVGEIRLRRVMAADDEFLRRLYASTRTDELARTGWDDGAIEQFLTMQWRAQTGDYVSRFPGSRHDIIRRGDHDIGRLWVDRPGDRIHLLDLAVLPEHRRRGVGTEVLCSLQREAVACEKPLVHSVLRDNRDALRLYRRLGFVVVNDEALHHLMRWDPPIAE